MRRFDQSKAFIHIDYSLSAGAPGVRLLPDVDVEEGFPVVFRRRCVEAVNRISTVRTRTWVKVPSSFNALRRERNRRVPPTIQTGSPFILIAHCCLPITRDQSPANVTLKSDRMRRASVPLQGVVVVLGRADGDTFVEIEFGELNAAPLGAHPTLGNPGWRETIGSPPILAIPADV